MLAERATGPYSVAIATDRGERLVPMLLATAGWALTIVDDESADDFAERFADELPEEADPAAAPTQRRALGLARALQAGALSATLLAPPAGLTDLKPVLAAHSALAVGRHAAAVALREVLRELYPAALRAYPDPADPVALAVLDALPEPGTLAYSSAGRGRDAAAAADAVSAQLAAAGVADQAAVTEAITALRVAIAETPRRGGVSKALTGTVAETVRQSVAAVRACDTASTALVNALAERVAAPRPAGGPPTPERAAPVAAPVPAPREVAPAPVRPEAAPAPGDAAPVPAPRPAPPPAPPPPPPPPPPPAPAVPAPAHAPARPAPVAAPAAASMPSPPPEWAPPPAPAGRPEAAPAPPWPAEAPTTAPPLTVRPPAPAHAAASAPPPPAPPGVAPPPVPSAPPDPRRGGRAPAHNRPVSSPPPPPPGITPITEPTSPAPAPARAATAPEAPRGTRDHPDQVRQVVQVPTPRPAPDRPARGSRSDWPTRRPAGDDWATLHAGAEPAPAASREAPPRRPEAPGSSSPPDRPGRREAGWSNGAAPREPSTGEATPPWRADDLPPPQPPTLRLVEPTLPEELRDGYGYQPPRPDPPPLRLVEPGGNGIPRSAPPVSADDDDSLLIFAQTRSAWFSQDPDTWESEMDLGWRAAEQAAKPRVEERTGAGLPRRVPHANLVPGAPPRRDDRPLRVVRDPASIAEHTSGYFNGWRRGQEVGGYPLGGRTGRQAAGAWEFHRDEDRLSG